MKSPDIFLKSALVVLLLNGSLASAQEVGLSPSNGMGLPPDVRIEIGEYIDPADDLMVETDADVDPIEIGPERDANRPAEHMDDLIVEPEDIGFPLDADHNDSI